jgi:transcription antitermination protein NusB
MNRRRLLREIALRSLYAYFSDPEDVSLVLTNVMRRDLAMQPELASEKADVRFVEDLILACIRLQDMSDALIGARTANWEVERTALIDRIILRMGITEFLEFEDIPTRVTINECIELAKNFSTAKSGKFVNGVLDAILIDLKSAGRIVKKGRGLIDTPSKS